MARRGLYALGLTFATLGLGLTAAHALETPGKRQLTGPEWIKVQHTFYFGYAIVGAISEVGGLAASLGILAADRKVGVRSPWPLIGAIGFAGMLGMYFLGNRPLNDQIATWTPETIPSYWMDIRDRWDTAHTTSAVFAAIAFGSLLAGGLTTTSDTVYGTDAAGSSSTKRSAAPIQPRA
jgi:hypothetical protein